MDNVWVRNVPKNVPKNVPVFMCGILTTMADKKVISQTRTHKLTVSGGKSYVIVLPVEFIRHLKWKERQKLDITLDGEKIIIKDWKK